MAPVVFKIQDDAPRTGGWLRKKGRRLKMWKRQVNFLYIHLPRFPEANLAA
jgi:hypothetical protein